MTVIGIILSAENLSSSSKSNLYDLHQQLNKLAVTG